MRRGEETFAGESLTQEDDDAGDSGRVDAGQDVGQDGTEPAGVVSGEAARQDVGDSLQTVREQGGPAAVGGEGVLRAAEVSAESASGKQLTCVRESPRIRTLDDMIPQLREQH